MAEEVTRLQHLLQETVNRQLQARLGLERSSEERVSLLEVCVVEIHQLFAHLLL